MILHLGHAFQKLITFIDNAEGLDFVMQMYNLLEYTENYSRTSESVWNDHRDEVSDGANEIDAADTEIIRKS